MIGNRILALYDSGSGTAPNNTIDLFLFCGESTSDGRGFIIDVPIAYEYIYQSQTPVKGWNYLTSSLVTYNAITFNTRNASNADKRFGPDAQFIIRAMLNTTGILSVVKVGIGGTTLEPGVNANGNWEKGDANSKYDVFLTAVNDGIAALEAAGFTPVVRGVFFMIGLNDATDNTATANFSTNFANFVTNIFTDIEMGSAKIYLGKPHVDADVDPTNLASIRSDCDAITDARVVVVDNDAYPLSSDDVHWDWQGEINVGDNFYDQYVING